MKNWDIIIVGAGIIGLSLARELRKSGTKILVVERGEPGREASSAAAGMLVDASEETLPALQPLASASARMYPEFVHELQDESGMNVDLRDQGTIVLRRDENPIASPKNSLTTENLAQLEPSLCDIKLCAVLLKERSVDPRALSTAALKAARHREVDISSGTTATDLLLADGRISGVVTEKSYYHAPIVVNCAGAWAGTFSTHHFPTRPVRGQMLSVVGGPKLQHVVRSPDVYLVPRTDGRILIGSTVEEAGFNKRTDRETIQRLHHAAIGLVPEIAQARIHEDWAGLRPGTPDNLPILGTTSTPGYFVAAGHFRDGILLTPITALLMAQVIRGVRQELDMTAFSPARFSSETTAP